MKISNDELNNFDKSIETEWLLTNGTGSYSTSTVYGCNTRKYHGLLVSELIGKRDRHLLLSKLNEVLHVSGDTFDLSTNECPEYMSEGYKLQTKFEYVYYPIFNYKVYDVEIKKQICMKYLENTVVIQYDITTQGNEAIFDVAPLVNNRSYHSINNGEAIFPQINFDKNNIKIVYDKDNDLYIYNNSDIYEPLKNVQYNNMYYRKTKARGMECLENHYIPGVFKIRIPVFTSRSMYFVISTVPQPIIDVDKVFEREELRLTRLIEKAGLYDPYANQLVLSSDQFIIKKNNDEYGIIAGYPWFGEWGRDTFISFEGLLLVTKRFDIAKNILKNAIVNIKDGIIPNHFHTNTKSFSYNTVDASLWFIEALYKYLLYTKDYEILNKKMYTAVKDILLAYIDGTDYNIHIDHDDGLIICGNENTNLTWMDAMTNGKSITPRNGKCVEINALWYNALQVMIKIIKIKNSKLLKSDLDMFKHLAEKCKKSFEEKFWNPNKNCLYDTIEPFSYDVRPNQVLSVSLSFPIFLNKNTKIMLDTIQDELYTPYGLRTLSPNSSKYIGHYTGDIISRDKAYHQGTVWAWLLSEFIISFCRINKYTLSDRKRWLSYIDVIKNNFNTHCINQLSEIFDGDTPHKPDGAFAQAWSVGNILKLFSEIE